MKRRDFIRECPDCQRDKRGKASHLPSAELYALLTAPIPEEYTKELSSGLTEINFSYQLKRMNDTLGLDGWSRKSRLLSAERIGINANSEKTQWEVSAEVVITIKYPGLKRVLNHFGASSNDVRSYAMKGAVTEATSKCFQELGIGWEIYARKPEPRVWGKSAVAVFRQGVILAWDAYVEGIARPDALQRLTEEFEREVEQSMTKGASV